MEGALRLVLRVQPPHMSRDGGSGGRGRGGDGHSVMKALCLATRCPSQAASECPGPRSGPGPPGSAPRPGPVCHRCSRAEDHVTRLQPPARPLLFPPEAPLSIHLSTAALARTASGTGY